MSVETIARRYGTALADVVIKTGETETVKAELKTWEEMMTSSADLLSAFSNPAIAHLDKEKVLESLISNAAPSRTTANFLRVLLKNNRLTELGDINDKFVAILEERGGIVAAHVTAARELSDDQKAELRSNLEKLTGKKVQLNFEINKEIIGGVVTRIGSTVYDSSVKTQLENLKEQLVNG
ncbi:MAG: F0F1 ATP synthase subunit delta [Pyrinomonadaceae bacterium]|jgi:F-type H+-transporting ATPase subunit delta|nr:F0F1 ATP synthase subunit delta [Pyrinomonadaceae bacterium]